MSTTAVIFDMDGVLVDSYQAHFESWVRMLAETGRTMTRSQFNATFGRTSREVLASLWRDDGLSDAQIAAMDARKEAIFRDILAADFPAMPGAKELIRRLHDASMAVGLGSSGPPENVALTLDRLGVRPYFAAVVTGGDVTRGKPDPQVFLLAAQRLGVAPSHCVVVEDAPLGIEAARRAGMAAVGIASTGRSHPMLKGADRVIGSLNELSPQILREIVATTASS